MSRGSSKPPTDPAAQRQHVKARHGTGCYETLEASSKVGSAAYFSRESGARIEPTAQAVGPSGRSASPEGAKEGFRNSLGSAGKQKWNKASPGRACPEQAKRAEWDGTELPHSLVRPYQPVVEVRFVSGHAFMRAVSAVLSARLQALDFQIVPAPRAPARPGCSSRPSPPPTSPA